MEYERIHKVQTGIISPSKLRMKLMGPHHQRKKEGSNSNSSRTSPSKLEDSEFVNNGLLASKNDDFDDEVKSPSLELQLEKVSKGAKLDPSDHRKDLLPRENGDTGRLRKHPKNDSTSSSTNAIHPVRITEDENPDYDSNASSSNFEFHKGERSGHGSITRSLSRPMSSKWNDAEKWIMSRQNVQMNYAKKNVSQNPGYRLPVTNMVKVAPELASSDHRLSLGRVAETKRVDFCHPGSGIGFDKFSFTPVDETRAYGGNVLIDPCSQTKDLKDVGEMDLSCSNVSPEDATSGIPAVRAVSMRDMGTEMTPVPSQEPSRTTTPMGASPLRSPTSSIPSTPRRNAPAPTPTEQIMNEECKELTEEELKVKTRREIVALGVKLGKMNIAAWASKDEQERDRKNAEAAEKEELERVEFEKRATAWEEAEKSKHTARYKREEIKIQAWESHQKAKLEAEMRNIEAQVEQMRAQAQVRMMKKIALARQQSEEKRAAAESKRNRDAERTAAQAEYIRHTGRMPLSMSHYTCCGWLS